LKIAFISSRSLYGSGGIENFMGNLLPGLVKLGHEVILYEVSNRRGIYDFKGVQVYLIKSIENLYLNKFITSLKATYHVIRNHRDIDLIHYNSVPCGLLVLFPILFNIKTIYQGHGFEWKRAKWKKWQRKFIKYADDLTIRLNNNITMVSQEQSNYVIEKFNKRSMTITPGVSISNKKKITSSILDKYKLQKNKYLLSLGRVVPEKKIEVIVDAFINIGYVHDIKLVIAGDDSFSRDYFKQIQQKSNNSNIIFTGGIFGDDKEYLLQNCLTFVMSSELEGLPITLLEAMSYQKRCVASNIAGCKEALGEGYKFLFPVNDTKKLTSILEKVIKDNNDFEDIGKQNFERVVRLFTWENSIGKYDMFAKQIINKIN
jgi:glycosyltransferase involved in cell wall biosynthesis